MSMCLNLRGGPCRNSGRVDIDRHRSLIANAKLRRQNQARVTRLDLAWAPATPPEALRLAQADAVDD